MAVAGETVALGDGWLADRWTRRDGLPVDYINDVVIDEAGDVWLATFDGLVRFDGVRFDTLRSTDPLGPPSSRVVYLAVHPVDHALWLVTEYGQVQRRSAGDVRSFDTTERVRVAPPSPGADALWIALDGRVYRLDEAPVPVEPPIEGIQGLLAAPGGDLWLLTREGRLLQRSTSGAVTDLGVAWTGPDSVLFRDVADGGPAFSTFSGLLHWDPQAGATVRLEQPGARSPSSADSSSRWAMDGETLLLDGAPLPGATWRVAALAAQGDVAWLATANAGLVRVRPRPVGVALPPDGQPTNVHRLWWEAPTRTLWALGDPQGWWPVYSEGAAPPPLPAVPPEVAAECGELRWRFFSGDQGERWLLRCDALWQHHGGVWEPVEGPTVDHEGPVWRTASGDLWLGGGVHTWCRSGGWWREITSSDGAFGTVLALGEGPDGAAILGTPRGLWRVERGAVEATRIDTVPDLGRVRDVRVEGGRVWIATEELGLCVGELQAGDGFAVRCLGLASGLARATVHASLRDQQGRVWVSSNQGLGVVGAAAIEGFAAGELDDVSAVWLSERDGMRHSEANNFVGDGAVATPDGRLWFATQDGVAVVVPDRVVLPEPVRLHWEQATSGSLVIAAPSALKLPATSPFVRLRWSAGISPWSDQAELRFRTSPTRPWMGASRERTVEIRAVAPGDSVIEAQARLGGAWGPVTTLPVTRAPTLAERGVYVWLSVIAGAVAIALAMMFRSRALRRANLRLEERVAEQTRQLSEWNEQLERALETEAEAKGRLEQQASGLAANNRILVRQEEELRASNRLVEAAASRLQELDTLKRQLIANVSHELRTPLALIKGPLQDLAAAGPRVEREARSIDLALTNAEHLEGLIQQLFDLSRAQAGGLRLRVGRVDLRSLIGRVCARFEAEARARGVSMDLVAPEAEVVWADADMVDRVLTNLLSNALRYAPAGSVVRFDLARTEQSTRVSVVDEGPGIAAEHRAHVFERFHQIDSGTTRAHGGAGLGLALAKELVELHGGEIGVADSAVGACLWFTLPLGSAHFSPDDISVTPTLAPAPDGPTPDHPGDPGVGLARVLLVEDHRELREYLAEHLRSRFAVWTAAGGAEALALAGETAIDVVVSDIMMPGMDGFELVRRLRERPDCTNVPVLFISARQELVDRLEGLELADDYLSKPFQAPELLARVSALYRRSRPAAAQASAGDPATSRASPDTSFLARLEAKADGQLAVAGFGVQALAKAMGMSPRALQLKMLELDLPVPSVWLLTRRLSAAEALLRSGAHATVGEVADAVGLSRTYFSRAYAAHTGRSPRVDLAT
jgi:signal transduction histidine kinase/DNA-binding response OmpR family regulator/ligand-binding sensor domain-containing protein